MKKIRIILKLSEEDQAELNYQNPNFQWDYESLMGEPFTSLYGPDVIQAIKKDIFIPDAYLNDYKVILNGNVILVMT